MCLHSAKTWGLLVTQNFSSQVMVTWYSFAKWVSCMSWSPGGMRDELITVPCNCIPSLEKKTESPVCLEGTLSLYSFVKGQHANSWFYIVSKSFGKHAQQWFVPGSYLFYFVWQQHEDRVSNKSPVLSLNMFH